MKKRIEVVRHPGGTDTEECLRSGFSGEDSFWTFSRHTLGPSGVIKTFKRESLGNTQRSRVSIGRQTPNSWSLT